MSRRTAVLTVTTAVLLATVGVPLALAASAGPTEAVATAIDGLVAAPVAQTATNDSVTTDMASNDNTASSETLPGQHLSAVIDVQGSETNDELEHRGFGARFVRANSSTSKTAIMATQVKTVRECLTKLEQRRDRLEIQRENGALSEGQYCARLTRTVVDIEHTQSMLNQTADAASTVPTQELSARGVKMAEPNRLRTNANELIDPEVTEIAHGIAGDPSKGIDRERAANETETDVSGRPGGPGRGDTPGSSHSKVSDRTADTRADIGNATNGAETDGHATSGTITDAAGDESDGAADGTDHGNAPKTPPGNDKRAKDVNGSDVAVPPADERSGDDATVTDDGTTTTDGDTTNDGSETSSADDSGA